MTLFEQYEQVKQLARIKREEHGIAVKKVGLRVIKTVYRQEGIDIVPCSKILRFSPRNLKAAYHVDGGSPVVLLNDNLPREPQIFALVHELKHHYMDSEELGELSCCRKYEEEPLIEKTAEVFAAEYIWPEADFLSMAQDFGLKKGSCAAEQVIAFKRNVSLPVSYTFITKRLEWFSFIRKGEFNGVHFKTLEDSIYQKPYWRIRKK